MLSELGLLENVRGEVARVFVASAGDGLEGEVFRLAEELRSAGHSAIYDTEGKSLKAQMKVAGKGGHRFAIILGPEELERRSVQLKDLESGEQREVPRADVAREIG